MSDVFVRRPSGMESFFIDLDACGCNMTFHFFLKLNKKPSLQEINLAFRRLLKTHGDINLKFKKNAWYQSDYLPECTLKEVDCDDISNYKPTHLEFKKNTISLNVIHLKPIGAWYLCFDFFHGVVDGRSGIQFVYDYFDVLNGINPKENDFSISDCEIVHTKEKSEFKNKIPFTVLANCKPRNWLPKKDGVDKTIIFKREICIKSAAARLSAAVGRCFSKKSAKVIIPVDVRRYSNNKKSLFGNLFVPIFVDAKRIRKVDELKNDIINYVKHQPILMKIANRLLVYSRISPAIRQGVIRFFLPIVMASRRFIYCALVSPLGQIESKRLQSKNFKVDDVNVTLISFPFTAFTVIALEYNKHTNVTVSWHSGRVPQKVANRLVERIDNYVLKDEAVEVTA